jgi:hypothetical protein
MSPYITLLVIITLVIFSTLLAIFLHRRRNGHTELYSEGLRHENAGQYRLALDNYQDALYEIGKLKLSRKFGYRIADRIRTLGTLMDYEKNFQPASAILRTS